MANFSPYSRRDFLIKLGHDAFSVAAVGGLAACTQQKNKSEQSMKQQDNSGKLGIALVGLGKYSTDQLAPALEETEHCYLAGIVTGTPEKADKWKRKYNIPEKNIYNYINFNEIATNPEIDIVYVVLPNAMHREYVVRAAEAGKHVICEKPMALTVGQCDDMINACNKAQRMLSIGYRLHFEPHNQEMMRLGQQKVFGQIKTLSAEHGMSSVEGWRIDKELAGGGPLMDVGIYCVQGVRYTTGMEPIAVTAREGVKKDRNKFKEVEESLSWEMEFPDGSIAYCKTSYSEEMNVLRADAENGWFELSPAYEYEGIKGETFEGKMHFDQVNQQARQMDDFALAIKNKRPSPVPGEMGKQDLKIMTAIYQAMESGKRITL